MQPPQVSGYLKISDDRQPKIAPFLSSLPVYADIHRWTAPLFQGGLECQLPTYAVSALGGDPIQFTNPFSSPVLFDISPDRSQMLFGNFTTTGEMPIWILPALGGSPRRVSGLVVADATFTPDGKKIVYAHENDLLVVQSQGGEPQKALSRSPVWRGGFAGHLTEEGYALPWTIRKPARIPYGRLQLTANSHILYCRTLMILRLSAAATGLTMGGFSYFSPPRTTGRTFLPFRRRQAYSVKWLTGRYN